MIAPSLSVALVHSHGGAPERAARRLEAVLSEAGHSPALIGGPGPRLAERILARRGFTPGLSGVPNALRHLGTGEFDLTHAFDMVAATAALVWGRRSGTPVVCSFAEALDRRSVADRRLRLRLLSVTLEEADAVLAANADARAGLLRWTAVDARIASPADAPTHERVYRELVDRRTPA